MTRARWARAGGAAALVLAIAAALVSVACDLIEDANAGLVYACESLEDAEHRCRVAHLKRMENIRDWCRVQRDETYDACVARKQLTSETELAQCITGRRQCRAGERCVNGWCESSTTP